MHRASDAIKHKVKVMVGLQKIDGSVLEGYVHLGGSERVLDLLNSGAPFLPLETQDDKFLLINKTAIIHVEPFDEEWMSSSVAVAPAEPTRPF